MVLVHSAYKPGRVWEGRVVGELAWIWNLSRSRTVMAGSEREY